MSANANDSTWATARILQNAIARKCRVRVAIEAHSRRSDPGPQLTIEHRDSAPGVAADRYRIKISRDAVEVHGGGPAGLRYAIETLAQLLGDDRSIPECEIDDEPDFEMRGVMLDASRGKVPTFDSLCGLVDILAKLKLNTLMLYTEHTFRFRKHPEIGKGASPLDAETTAALDQYASEHHVALVPCLQSLGHMDHILELPRYRELAETDMGWTIAPTHPGTLELLGDLYDEYLPNFRSSFFNANCDEPWDLGRGQSAERNKELGPGGLYLEHVTALRSLAKRHGKRTMIWGDVVHAHPKRIGQIPKDMVMLDWWYEADFDYSRVAVFKKNKLDFAVCPGTSSWNSLFPRVENSTQNIANWAKAGREHGAIGLINTDWGDFGHYNLQGNSWYAYAIGAQQSWSGECDAKAFDRAFSERLFGDTGGQSRAADLYKELGAIHDAGFKVFNGSPLQYLFFDTLEESYFVNGCKKGALERSKKKLAAVKEKIDETKGAFREEKTTWHELHYAADASMFAVDKAIAGRHYNAWRSKPKSFKARDRSKLATSLRDLAKTQAALLTRLRKLWHKRAASSNFAMTERRIKRSIKSLRAAALNLSRNRPPEKTKPVPIEPAGVVAAVRRSFQ